MDRVLNRGGWTATLLLAAFLALPAAAHIETKVITITGEGFAPRDATIDTDGLVRFVNDDMVDHWPASDVHPTHDRYPEFDPTRAIAPGSSWFFRPNRAGIWTYHDHLFPHRRGTLRVIAEPGSGRVLSGTLTPVSEPAQSLLPARPEATGWTAQMQRVFSRLAERASQWFRRHPTRAQLVPQELRNLPEKEQYATVRELSRTNGLEPAWQFVKDAYTSEAGASLGGRAHDLAHLFGGLVWNARGLKGLSVCDSTFAFGCYHGFTEAAFTENLDRLPDLARACETIGPQNSGPWASCIHGIGHGVATYYASNDLGAALNACETLARGTTYCHDGVFMEFSFTAPPSFYRAQDPLHPCLNLAARYQQACARNQPQVMQRLFHMNRRAVAGACMTAPSIIADPCIDALGFALANESQGSPDIILSRCREVPTPLAQAKCASAAAGELVFQNFPQWPARTQAVCNALSPEFRPACHQRVRETAENYRHAL